MRPNKKPPCQRHEGIANILLLCCPRQDLRLRHLLSLERRNNFISYMLGCQHIFNLFLLEIYLFLFIRPKFVRYGILYTHIPPSEIFAGRWDKYFVYFAFSSIPLFPDVRAEADSGFFAVSHDGRLNQRRILQKLFLHVAVVGEILN